MKKQKTHRQTNIKAENTCNKTPLKAFGNSWIKGQLLRPHVFFFIMCGSPYLSISPSQLHSTWRDMKNTCHLIK